MHSFQITDLRIFMLELLRGSAFDAFQTVSVSLKTFCSFQIDGLLLRDFFDTDPDGEELPEYIYWKQLKNAVFEQVKGKTKPSSIHIVFRVRPEAALNLLEEGASGSLQNHNISSYFLNVVYLHSQDAESLTCTTGAAFRSFTMDRSAETAWDELMAAFLRKYHFC